MNEDARSISSLHLHAKLGRGRLIHCQPYLDGGLLGFTLVGDNHVGVNFVGTWEELRETAAEFVRCIEEAAPRPDVLVPATITLEGFDSPDVLDAQ